MADERQCEECGHLIRSHDSRYGCEYDRGDGWVTGNQAGAPTVLCALGPCGCKTPTVECPHCETLYDSNGLHMCADTQEGTDS